MAGDWIKLEKATSRKPEVIAIAESMGVDVDHALGVVVRYLSWCDDHVTNGHARSVTQKGLNMALGVTGFAEALEVVEWADFKNGHLVIINFDRHLSKGAKTRALSTNRKGNERSRKCHDESVTKARPEKRREDSNKEEQLVVLPFDSPAFAAAWQDWLSHKKEIKQKMPPTTIKAQLKKCEKWGEQKSILAIENAIAGKWQGLYESKESAPAQRPLFDEPTYRKNGKSEHRPLWD